MSIIRIKKDKNHPYVLLNKSFLEDQNLSLKAKGLLAYCLSKPDHWQFHVSQLITVLKEGKAAIWSILNELILEGYAQRIQTKNKHGQFQAYEYLMFEKKLKKKVPHTGSPRTENRTLVINDISVSNDILSNHHQPPPFNAIESQNVAATGGGEEEFIFPKLFYLNPKGKQVHVSREVLLKRFLDQGKNYPTAIIMQAMEEAQKANQPISNIFAYVNSICARIIFGEQHKQNTGVKHAFSD